MERKKESEKIRAKYPDRIPVRKSLSINISFFCVVLVLVLYWYCTVLYTGTGTGTVRRADILISPEKKNHLARF